MTVISDLIDHGETNMLTCTDYLTFIKYQIRDIKGENADGGMEGVRFVSDDSLIASRLYQMVESRRKC